MALYRFVGSFALAEDLPGKQLSTFGQQINISDELAAECIAHRRIDLVTEAAWQEQNVTDEEMKNWPESRQHAKAPEEFKAKKTALLKAAQEQRAEILSQPIA